MDSVSTISDAKPFTVLSVPSDDEIASNYHNERFPFLTSSSDLLSFHLILPFLTVFRLLNFSSPHFQTSPNSNPVYFTSLHSHLQLFNNSQSCLSNDSHLLNFVSLNTNFCSPHSNNFSRKILKPFSVFRSNSLLS